MYKKTKTMVFANSKIHHTIKLDGTILQQVENYSYLGTIIEEIGKVDKEIDTRLGKSI